MCPIVVYHFLLSPDTVTYRVQFLLSFASCSTSLFCCFCSLSCVFLMCMFFKMEIFFNLICPFFVVVVVFFFGLFVIWSFSCSWLSSQSHCRSEGDQNLWKSSTLRIIHDTHSGNLATNSQDSPLLIAVMYRQSNIFNPKPSHKFNIYFLLGPKRYGILVTDADTDIRGYENSDIRYIDRYSIYDILNVVIKYVRQRY